jgi:tripartite ATP-independent transporter DctP family solute receptor
MKKIYSQGLKAILLGASILTLNANAQFQERTIRASVNISKEHSLGVALTKVSQCVAQKSGGRMKIQPFFDGSLGNDGPTIQQLRSGTLDMVVTVTSFMSTMVPAAAAFDLPFVFANEKEADAAMDGKAGEILAQRLETQGMVTLAYWENGFRNATNSKLPITKMEDMRGLKFRVIPNPMMVETFKALGGFAVPMPFTEVYSALETKTVDGQENPVPVIEAVKFHEVQKYLSLTRHMYNPGIVIYSKQLFDKLSPAEQSALRDCSFTERLAQRQLNRQQAEEGIGRLKAKGMLVNAISPAEFARMRDAIKPVYEKALPAIGADMMTALNNDVKSVAGK